MATPVAQGDYYGAITPKAKRQCTHWWAFSVLSGVILHDPSRYDSAFGTSSLLCFTNNRLVPQMLEDSLSRKKWLLLGGLSITIVKASFLVPSCRAGASSFWRLPRGLDSSMTDYRLAASTAAGCGTVAAAGVRCRDQLFETLLVMFRHSWTSFGKKNSTLGDAF